jgi:hypothetical protein
MIAAQGSIDWAAVASSGIAFAMCKATEGTTYQDPTFPTNFEAIQVGVYVCVCVRARALAACASRVALLFHALTQLLNM